MTEPAKLTLPGSGPYMASSTVMERTTSNAIEPNSGRAETTESNSTMRRYGYHESCRYSSTSFELDAPLALLPEGGPLIAHARKKHKSSVHKTASS
eukprot:5301-Heterococcus_DN1.PRE.2